MLIEEFLKEFNSGNASKCATKNEELISFLKENLDSLPDSSIKKLQSIHSKLVEVLNNIVLDYNRPRNEVQLLYPRTSLGNIINRLIIWDDSRMGRTYWSRCHCVFEHTSLAKILTLIQVNILYPDE